MGITKCGTRGANGPLGHSFCHTWKPTAQPWTAAATWWHRDNAAGLDVDIWSGPEPHPWSPGQRWRDWGCFSTAQHHQFCPVRHTKPQGCRHSVAGSTLREEPRGIRFCWWGHHPREFPLLDSGDPQLQRRWVLGAASPSQRLGSSFAQQGSALPCFPEKRETKEEEGEGSFFLLKGTSSNFLGGEKPYSEGKNTQWSRSPSNPQQCMGKEQSCLPAHPEPLDSGWQPCTGLQGTEPVGAAAKPSVGSGG